MKKIIAVFVLLLLCVATWWLCTPARQWTYSLFMRPVICLQPFSDMSPEQAQKTYIALKRVIPDLQIANALPLPANAWYAKRGRYRADTIIHWLRDRSGDTMCYIGMTSKDISTDKGKVADWGVMGLGFQPGLGCVVSTYRLVKANEDEQLYKLCLHELGHNMGLPHCVRHYCYMRDAEGGNHKDEETGFCRSCASKLESKGLHFVAVGE